MATIMDLPNKVTNIILSYSDITIEDIINFRCVCKQFREAAKYHKHEEIKFVQRWSYAKKMFDKLFGENKQKESKENEQKDKKDLNFIKAGKEIAIQLPKLVSELIDRPYEPSHNINHPDDQYYSNLIDNYIQLPYIYDINEYYFFREIYNPENFIINSLVIDELKNLLAQSPRRTGFDLTKRHCDTKLLHFMRQSLVKKEWISYEKLPCEEQLFERIATIMAQWIQPEKHVFYSSVQASLNSIAQGVLNCLKEKHPDHSIFSTSAETFSYWENNNFDENYWDETEGTQIMDTLQKYILNLNFRSCESNNLDNNLEYMCIDYVLKNKHGYGIILVIIFHSVARRLGLRCVILQLPCRGDINKFNICWKSNYKPYSQCALFYPKNVRYFDETLKKSDNLIKKLSYNVTAREVWTTLIDIFSSVIYHNKFSRLNPHNIGYRWPIRRFRLCFKKTEQLNIRPTNVKFAAGMIVEHSDEHKNSCTGVIVGWCRPGDKYIKCRFFTESLSYDKLHLTNIDTPAMPLIHCCNESFTKRQTNYVILTENNEMCYVPEDTISLTTPKWINNSEIGRYFCKFEGTHYVPNNILTRVYPYDAAVTANNI